MSPEGLGLRPGAEAPGGFLSPRMTWPVQPACGPDHLTSREGRLILRFFSEVGLGGPKCCRRKRGVCCALDGIYTKSLGALACSDPLCV